jgi:hypothetical protein
MCCRCRQLFSDVAGNNTTGSTYVTPAKTAENEWRTYWKRYRVTCRYDAGLGELPVQRYTREIQNTILICCTMGPMAILEVLMDPSMYQQSNQ